MSLPDMVGEGGSRPILPQSQSSAFQFADSTSAPREAPIQRNYVFVDEHNRHKRLKVMRACEGCRRRKIKCDAATTNSWPCAACTRLKLNCVPPTVSYEKDGSQPGVHTFELQRTNEYPTIPVGTISDYQRPQSMYQMPQHNMQSNMHAIPSQTYEPLSSYSSASYVAPTTAHEVMQFNTMPTTTMGSQNMSYHTSYAPNPVSAARQDSLGQGWKNDGNALHRANSLDSAWPRANVDVSGLRQNSLDSTWKSDSGVSPSADALAEALGGLKIDHLAVAPYIADRNKLAEAPAVEEYEPEIPQHTSPDSRLRIPPEMMPSEEQALRYFQYYFSHIHSYVPVLNRTSFLQQWTANRDSISPLLLEAIFACTTMTSGDPEQGNKWLALATKHEESFKDVPRLSTIQASLILLKARESAPKRGYFYRSWMTVVNVVAMAKDLEIHEHKFEQMQGTSQSSVYDSVAKTRIWQLLYCLEAMIGGPQGRHDFGVDPDTVDLDPPARVPGLDDNEFQISIQFVYFARVVRNVRGSILLYARLRKTKKDWYADPDFIGHDASFDTWMREVPQGLRIDFPEDGSMPYLPNPFIANTNCYHYLSVIMQHRPQIHYMTATDRDWQHHMIQCHDAAKKMCRIQEAILENFGMAGMVHMQRGISFPVYCVLTCTMLHLASITSPDPALNCEARDFFIRHMRILEQCIPHWPLPEVQAQVNSLRTAFSADINKPFDLRPSFPFGSPTMAGATPPTDGAYHSLNATSARPSVASHGYPASAIAAQHPITPPVSTTDEVPKADSPLGHGIPMMTPQGQTSHGAMQSQDGYHPQQQQWNPTKIFDQWNSAFGTPQSSTASQPSPPMQRSQVDSYEVRSTPNPMGPQFNPNHATSYPAQDLVQNNLPPQQAAYANQSSSYVTPSMWQEVVANSLVDGRKRMWQYSDGVPMGTMKRQR